MTANAGSEGPSIPTVEPATPATWRRGAGFVLLIFGIASIAIGLVGLFFFFMVPALGLVLLGAPLVTTGSRWFARGKPRLPIGPGRAA